MNRFLHHNSSNYKKQKSWLFFQVKQNFIFFEFSTINCRFIIIIISFQGCACQIKKFRSSLKRLDTTWLKIIPLKTNFSLMSTKTKTKLFIILFKINYTKKIEQNRTYYIFGIKHWFLYWHLVLNIFHV